MNDYNNYNHCNDYVDLPLGLLASPLWESPHLVTLYVYCLLKADEPCGGSREAGRFFTSAPAIARELKQSRNGVRAHLKRLEALGAIRMERSSRGLQITVMNINENGEVV